MCVFSNNMANSETTHDEEDEPVSDKPEKPTKRRVSLPVIQDTGGDHEPEAAPETNTESPPSPEHNPDDYRVVIDGLGNLEPQHTNRMRTHFLRILNGYIDRYHHAFLNETKWRFTTMKFEYRKRGFGYITIHGKVELFQMQDKLDRFFDYLSGIEERDRANRCNTVVYINLDSPYPDRLQLPEPRWRKYGMFEGSETMLHYGDRILSHQEGVLTLLTPADRKRLLSSYNEFREKVKNDP